MRLVLLVGQSNMAGRGYATPDDLVPLPGQVPGNPLRVVPVPFRTDPQMLCPAVKQKAGIHGIPAEHTGIDDRRRHAEESTKTAQGGKALIKTKVLHRFMKEADLVRNEE